MGLKKAENQVKILLAETILSMCRNTLNYHAEICVEGLLGITLDNEEIFLVNINQTIKNQVDAQTTQSKESTSKENLKRVHKDDEGSESDPESSSNESGDGESTSSSKKRRKRVRRKKHKEEKAGSESEGLEETPDLDSSNQNDSVDIDKRCIQVNPVASEQYYENSNLTTDSYNEEGAPSGVNVTVKQEPPGDEESDDDLVFVKQEVDDMNMSQPSAQQFSNLSQVFGNSSADMSLSQPSDFMSGAFFNSPANNMSANAMQQPVPGPSGATPGCVVDSVEPVEVTVDGRKGYSCPWCERVVLGPKRDYLRHIRIHTGERPFRCTRCRKTFSRRHHVKGHWLSMHKDVEFQYSYVESSVKYE